MSNGDKTFRLVPGPNWTDDPSLKLEMIDVIADHIISQSSMVFPETMLSELIRVLQGGPDRDHHPEHPND